MHAVFILSAYLNKYNMCTLKNRDPQLHFFCRKESTSRTESNCAVTSLELFWFLTGRKWFVHWRHSGLPRSRRRFRVCMCIIREQVERTIRRKREARDARSAREKNMQTLYGCRRTGIPRRFERVRNWNPCSFHWTTKISGYRRFERDIVPAKVDSKRNRSRKSEWINATFILPP